MQISAPPNHVNEYINTLMPLPKRTQGQNYLQTSGKDFLTRAPFSVNSYSNVFEHSKPSLTSLRYLNISSSKMLNLPVRNLSMNSSASEACATYILNPCVPTLDSPGPSEIGSELSKFVGFLVGNFTSGIANVAVECDIISLAGVFPTFVI